MFIKLLLAAGIAFAAPSVKWGNIPLSFEPNTGQAAGDIQGDIHYVARGTSYSLYLACGETLLAGKNQSPPRTRLSGANASCRISGEAPQSSTSNYFVGGDPGKWRTSVPNYGKVRYKGVYPGVDLVYYGKDGHLEYDWIVAPGADAASIRMVFESAGRLQIDRQGDLVIEAGKSEYRHKKPSFIRRSRANGFLGRCHFQN